MISRIHQKLGTAGFVISIVALVAALGGGAYAASGGLTGKQKKEVKSIAKQYAGKPGAAGATGPAGPAGGKGDTGAAGSNGTNGTDGADGSGVTSSTVGLGGDGGKCVGVGGTKFESASGVTYACNGAKGEEGEPGQTGFAAELPEGKTEVGGWQTEGGVAGQTKGYANISFPFPISNHFDYTPVYVPEEEALTGCPGNYEAPSADPGYLCIYEAVSFGAPPPALLTPEGSVGVVGAVGQILRFTFAGEAGNFAQGTWALTAIEA